MTPQTEQPSKKDIRDYIGLYLPFGVRVFIFTDESITDGFLDKYKNDYPNGVYNPVITYANHDKMLKDGYKPILRRLSDMTEEEINKCGNLDYDFSGDEELNKWEWKNFECLLTPNQFLWLLKRHLDLFELIESGVAIDAKFLTP